MPGITIHINKNGFDDAIARCQAAQELIHEAAVRSVSESTEVLYAEAVALINKRTGRTAGTVDRAAEGLTGYVGSDDKVAEVLEYGSSPHEIPPRVIYPRLHPGTQEYAWLLRAGLASTFSIEEIFDANVGAAFEAI